MPHQIIEYSENLEDLVDVRGLVQSLHDTASTIEALPLAGLETRAVAREHCLIADGHPDNTFVNVTLRLARGRSLEEREDAGAKLFEALRKFLAPALAAAPLSLSYEIQEIDPDLHWEQSNIAEYLKRRQN